MYFTLFKIFFVFKYNYLIVIKIILFTFKKNPNQFRDFHYLQNNFKLPAAHPA